MVCILNKNLSTTVTGEIPYMAYMACQCTIQKCTFIRPSRSGKCSSSLNNNYGSKISWSLPHEVGHFLFCSFFADHIPHRRLGYAGDLLKVLNSLPTFIWVIVNQIFRTGFKFCRRVHFAVRWKILKPPIVTRHNKSPTWREGKRLWSFWQVTFDTARI